MAALKLDLALTTCSAVGRSFNWPFGSHECHDHSHFNPQKAIHQLRKGNNVLQKNVLLKKWRKMSLTAGQVVWKGWIQLG